MADGFAEIDQKRRSVGMKEYILCRNAGVSACTYWRLKKNPHQARFLTLNKLRRGLDGPQPRVIGRPPASIVGSLFNSMAVMVAITAGFPIDQMLQVDPHRNTPKDLNWLAAMQLRQVAAYLVVTTHNIRGSELAGVLGVSKQAVSKQLARVEAMRDDPKFSALLDRMDELLRMKVQEIIGPDCGQTGEQAA